MDTDTDSTTQSTCEYGITAVDPITATITLGQFADDQLHSRLQTLLTNFTPSEIIFESGENGASPTLLGLLKSCCPKATIRPLGINDTFPTSFAVKEEDQRAIERKRKRCNPWSGEEAMEEVHRRGYYPRGSKNSQDSTDRWPEVLKACVEGGAELALSSFAAALYYLQSHLVDEEILGMGIVKAYVPPNGGASQTTPLEDIYQREARHEGGVDLMENDPAYLAEEATIDHLALDGTTLNNLEILHNLSSGSSKGSLLSKIDFTKSPHGSRLLRAWLLRPLFIKSEIDRRADAVSELSSGAAAMAMGEARDLLKKTGDIERLLTRVHSMGGGGDGRGSHPDDRAIFYENEKHNRRKVGDFSKLLNGLKAAAHIPEKFDGVSVVSPLVSSYC
jgi:DNA mismatch repair protein MSH6